MPPAGRIVRLRLVRGSLERTPAACLITPANDSLVGNEQPMYWRFINRQSVDAKIRQAAGPELERVCLAIEPLPADEARRVRRDITRWTTGCKAGNSAVVRCPTGGCVSTPAFGDLDASAIVHAVAPDSEFGYEGLYTGALRDEEASGVSLHSPAPNLGKHSSWLQFSPPDQLLFSAWHGALGAAAAVAGQNETVATAALGAGVKGWRHTISAALGMEALAQLLVQGDRAPAELCFVIGGDAAIAARAWRQTAGVAHTLLGSPPGLEPPGEWAKAREAGVELVWEMDAGRILENAAGRRRQNDDDRLQQNAAGRLLQNAAVAAGSLLPLMDVADVAEMHKNRAVGYSGADRALTSEQELRAARLGDKRMALLTFVPAGGAE